MRKIIGVFLLFFLLVTIFFAKDILLLGKICFDGFIGHNHGIYDCVYCDFPGHVNTTFIQCMRCSNRKMLNGECVLKCSENAFRTKNSYCDSCSNHNSLVSTKKECDRCPNRIYKNGLCILKNCPEGRYRVDNDCLSCEDEQSRRASEEECIKCPNRKIVKIENNQTFCAPKCDGKCYDYKGSCYNCGDCKYLSAYSVSEEECSKCPNREMKEGLCQLKECPPDTYRSGQECLNIRPIYSGFDQIK